MSISLEYVAVDKVEYVSVCGRGWAMLQRCLGIEELKGSTEEEKGCCKTGGRRWSWRCYHDQPDHLIVEDKAYSSCCTMADDASFSNLCSGNRIFVTPVKAILQCDLYSRMTYTPGWPIFQDDLYSRMTYIPGWPIFQGDLYSRVTYIPGWPILQCDLYSRVTYIPGWPILQCDLYSSATYTPGWPIFKGDLHSSAIYTPGWPTPSAI